ncbi:MAG: C39 family peptidase [Candidatus Dormibacteria bacterium]
MTTSRPQPVRTTLTFSAYLLVAFALAALGVRVGLVSGVSAASSAGAAYFPLSPRRLLDTRSQGGALGPGQTMALQIAGTDAVPADASAVVLNVTVTDPTSAGFLSVYPQGAARPEVSNLNWTAGETLANLVLVSLGNGGVTIYNQSGATEVVVDLQGYFAPPSGSGSGEYVPVAPSRIADTRAGSGEPYSGSTLGPQQTLDVAVAGQGGIPSSGAAAVVLNVTAVGTTANSFLSIYPAGQANPKTSTLNWTAGSTVANRVVVPLGAGGAIAAYNWAGNTNLVVDVDGYFTASATSVAGASLFVPIVPTRILDTRVNAGTLGPQGSLTEQVAGLSSVAASASAVVANLTATDTTQASFFTLSPSGGAPTTSDLNWQPGETVANLAISPLNQLGNLSLYNNQGSAAAILDVFGYFQPAVAVAGGPEVQPCSDSLLSAPTQAAMGSVITVSVQSDCPSGATPYYSYWYRAPGQLSWSLAVSGSTDSSYAYPSADWTAGGYQLLAWVGSESGVYQQQLGAADTQVIPPPCTGVSVSVSPNPGLVSAPVVVTAAPQCPAVDSPAYAYFVQSGGAAARELSQGWTSQASLPVSTQGWAAATYTFTVEIASYLGGPEQAQAVAVDSLRSSGSIVVGNVPYSPQAYGMDCEEAALEMALAHQGILLQGNNVQSQNDILGAEGVDRTVPGIGPSYTSGDPMQNFIGPPNGPEAAGYEPGAYYGAVVKAARAFGAQVLAAGEGISMTQLELYLEEGHPVQAWVSFNFQHYTPTFLSNGHDSWPWAGPHEHSVMVVGIGVNAILIDNPWDQTSSGAPYTGPLRWVPLATFEGAYSSYAQMAVVLN